VSANGTNEYLQNTISGVASGIDSGSFSFMFVVRPTGSVPAGVARLFELGDMTLQNLLFLTWEGGVANDPLRVEIRNSSAGRIKRLDWNSFFSIDTGVHAVGTFDGGSSGDPFVLYNAASPLSPSTTLNDTPGTYAEIANAGVGLLAGRSGSSVLFGGDLQDFAIWNSVLTSTEVAELYASRNNPGLNLASNFGDYASASTLVHWWTPSNPSDIGNDYGSDPIDLTPVNLDASDVIAENLVP
jgi:hypothetical protein